MDIPVVRNILESNEKQADVLRSQFYRDKTLVLNLISSPGSGKTSLLEYTLKHLADTDYSMAVIEGDPETEKDAERISKTGIDVVQIETNGGCHLNSTMVAKATEQLPHRHFDLLFIENVGNLVCPVEFDCGEDAKIALLSVTEGDDKPKKYPGLFHKASVLLITKTDLLPYVRFNMEQAVKDAKSINPNLRIFPVSCETGDGMNAWLQWLKLTIHHKQTEETEK